MSQKVINVDGIGDVPFYKRRDAATIKIRVSGSDIKVSMPMWVPYKAAVAYVSQRSEWIVANRKPSAVLNPGSKIGKNTVLRLQPADVIRFSSKYTNNQLIIRFPSQYSIDSRVVQERVKKYAISALQREAEELLLPLVRKNAAVGNFSVNKIEVKNLKSRWGSCSSRKDLAFSLFLIQLPWHCIEYVIYHELAHTIHMNHSAEFWALVAQFVPNYKDIRREMKQYSPHIVLQA